MLAGALLGLFMESLPAPSDTGTFWVGNFSAPWAVLAFAAGWAQRSRLWAAIGSAAAEVAIVVGFYGQGLVGDFVNPRNLLGPEPYPGHLPFIETAVANWLSLAAPWLVLAIGAGVVYGVLGRWWGQSRSVVAGVAIALLFFVEPLAWRLYDGFLKGPLAVGRRDRGGYRGPGLRSPGEETAGQSPTHGGGADLGPQPSAGHGGVKPTHLPANAPQRLGIFRDRQADLPAGSGFCDGPWADSDGH